MEALVLYVPVVHRGYINLLMQHPGQYLHVLGESLLSETPHLKKDARAVRPDEAASMLRSLGVAGRVEVLEAEGVEKFLSHDWHIIMPDEEVSRAVAEKYFGGREVAFEPVFLRWHKKIVAQNREAEAARKVSHSEFDRMVMGQAYAQAHKSSDWWRQVGAAAVKGGNILFTAYNAHLPSEHTPYIVGDPRSNFDAGERTELSTAIHAEVKVIAEAAKQGVALEGADLYVTTFPCPACSYAIAEAGIARIFYSEGYSLLEGEAVLRAKGVELIRIEEPLP